MVQLKGERENYSEPLTLSYHRGCVSGRCGFKFGIGCLGFYDAVQHRLLK